MRINPILVLLLLVLTQLSGCIGNTGAVETSSWPLEQVEIVEITNEGRTVVGSGMSHYPVEIRFLYEDDERVWTLICYAERDADVYVEENPVGTIIDIRVNPVKGKSPFFDIEGGCPNQPWEIDTEEVIGAVIGAGICFVLAIPVIGFVKIIEKIRSKKQE